jgi:hypothetical protein
VANNLHISYDLKNPGRDYENIIAAVKQLGGWAKIHYSYWYVSSEFSAQQARDHLLVQLDSNDSLYVVNSTDNTAAHYNISPEVAAFMSAAWAKRAA